MGGQSGEEARVLWWQIDGRMFPSVYTLWRNPGIVPLLHTPGIVVKKLQGGADLMTPGLAGGPPFPEMAKKDAVVAVASTDAPNPRPESECKSERASRLTPDRSSGAVLIDIALTSCGTRAPL